MNTETYQARAREFFTTMNDPDAWRETLDQLFSDDVHWKVPAGTPAEIQQINRGKESVVPALVGIFGKVFAPGSVAEWPYRHTVPEF